jgi:hypothetical protein
MSGESQSSRRGHIYRPPSGEDHNRHIQSITDHTGSLFPETKYQLPQLFTPSANDWNRESLTNPLRQITDGVSEYGGLDDFGRHTISVVS